MINPCLFCSVDNNNKLAVWEVTKNCELGCPHCCSNSGLRFIEKDYNDIDEAGAVKILDLLHKNGFNQLYLSGGEPLLWKPLVEVVQHAIELNIDCDIATSGFSQNSRILEQLFKLKISAFHVSLDSYCAEKHDAFRGTTLAFEKALNFIKQCKEHGFMVVTSTLISDDLIEHVQEMMDLLSSSQVDLAAFNFLVPLGRATDTYTNIFTTDQKKETAQLLADAAYKNGLNVTIKRTEKTPGQLQKCPAGRYLVHFNAYGNISPCSWIGKMWNEYVFDPKDEFFDEATLLMLEKRINLYTDKKCLTCKYENDCGRGCPVIAYFEEEKYDKLCGY